MARSPRLIHACLFTRNHLQAFRAHTVGAVGCACAAPAGLGAPVFWAHAALGPVEQAAIAAEGEAPDFKRVLAFLAEPPGLHTLAQLSLIFTSVGNTTRRPATTTSRSISSFMIKL